MKFLYARVLTVMLITFFICLVCAVRTKKPIVKPLKYLSIVVLITMGFSLSATMAVDRNVALIFQGLRYGFTDIVLLMLLYFVRVYTGYDKVYRRMSGRVKRVFRTLMALAFIILIVDFVTLVSNFATEHVFCCEVTTLADGGNIFIFKMNPSAIKYHMIFVIVIFAISVFMLWKKILDTDSFYKAQYIITLILLLIGASINTLTVFNTFVLDISVFIYISIGIFLSLYPVFFIPRFLTNKMLDSATSSMSAGIVCFDRDGECIYVNDLMYDIIGRNIPKIRMNMAFTMWTESISLSEIQSRVLKKEDRGDGGVSYYEIEAVNLTNSKKSDLGYFFMVYNRTVSFERLERERYVLSHDPLTSLFNKEHFYTEAERLIGENPSTVYYMIVSNIKDFKLVNDLFGKETGDRVLLMFGNLLRERVGEGAVYGRLVADHFALLLPSDRFEEEVFRECIAKMAEMIEREAENFRFKICLGVYEISDEERELPAAIFCDRAALALETIRSDYRYSVAYYTKSMMNAVLREKRIIGEFENAILNGDFKIYLQAQADTAGKVGGAEALVRWVHPESGVVPPGEFIGIFEKTGLIYRMDYFIWEESCKLLAEWKKAGIDQYISINISPRDLYYLDIYNTFIDLVKKYDIDVEKLHLELTETALMSDPKKQIVLIQKLREYGFIVEIDDFGSGYSSLNMLKDIEVDVVKLDMEFLREASHGVRGRAILQMIVELVKKLNMELVVEGVETYEQFDMMRGMGCDIFQGYYFSKPISVEDYSSKYLAN